MMFLIGSKNKKCPAGRRFPSLAQFSSLWDGAKVAGG